MVNSFRASAKHDVGGRWTFGATLRMSLSGPKSAARNTSGCETSSSTIATQNRRPSGERVVVIAQTQEGDIHGRRKQHARKPNTPTVQISYWANQFKQKARAAWRQTELVSQRSRGFNGLVMVTLRWVKGIGLEWALKTCGDPEIRWVGGVFSIISIYIFFLRLKRSCVIMLRKIWKNDRSLGSTICLQEPFNRATIRQMSYRSCYMYLQPVLVCREKNTTQHHQQLNQRTAVSHLLWKKTHNQKLWTTMKNHHPKAFSSNCSRSLGKNWTSAPKSLFSKAPKKHIKKQNQKALR